MTYLLKLQRTRNGTTTEHTVFADEKPILGIGGMTIVFDGDAWFVSNVEIIEIKKLDTPINPASTFNNKSILEKLEAE
jgi:hypothetical protein